VSPLAVAPLGSADEARWCAERMSESEPWRTLGRDFHQALAVVSDPAKETWIARAGSDPVAFAVLDLRGPLSGYLQSVWVDPSRRGQGIGTELIRWVEARIHRESPNVFLCVSTFNHDARRLYERLGYHAIGVLDDFLVAGHGETLMRKTLGPWSVFRERQPI
jgi:ribosomal protein S18 acetylase RimI-like enzyme